MAGVRSDELITHQGWPLGVVNVGREDSVPAGALREAVNVDVDGAGKISRRPGATEVSDTPTHSAWAHPLFPYLLAIQDGDVVAMDELEQINPLGIGLENPELPGSFALVAGLAYFTNGRAQAAIGPDLSVRSWWAECPLGQPSVTVQAGVGGLTRGTYQVAMTFVDLDGREGGSTLPVEVVVPKDGDGLLLSNFPAAQDPRTALVRIYRTKPDGTELYRAMEIPAGMSTVLLGNGELTARLDTLMLVPMPPGQIVRAGGGRLLVAQGRALYYSEALMYGLMRADNYTLHEGEITLVEPVGNAESLGWYVSAAPAPGKSSGRTYYLAGPDPRNWPRVIAHPHAAVRGASAQVEASSLGFELSGTVPVWLTDGGQLVAGLPGGQVVDLHAGRYVAPEHASAGAISLREYGGLRHLIATVRGGIKSGLAASDQAEAEVWKNGVRIA